MLMLVGGDGSATDIGCGSVTITQHLGMYVRFLNNENVFCLKPAHRKL